MKKNHNPPTQILFRGAAYRLVVDPIERDAERIVEQVVLRELRRAVLNAGEAAYQENPFQPTSWYVERLTPVVLTTLLKEGYNKQETEQFRPHVEGQIIKMVESIYRVYTDMEEGVGLSHQGAGTPTLAKQLKFHGVVYQLVKHSRHR